MSDIKWANDTVKLSVLEPWLNNPRYSTEAQVERITDSHRMFGQVEIFAVGPNNELYNGHQRLSAWLAEYGPDFEVDVRRSSRPLDEAEKQALTAMLHAGAIGSWDWDTLANWDADILKDFGFDEDLLKSWQTDTFALGDLLASEDEQGDNDEPPEPQIDKADELRKKWGVELGQMWQLGEHIIGCIDSANSIQVEWLLNGKLFGALVADPPYGVNYDGGRNPKQAKRKKLKGDETGELYSRFLPIWAKHRAKKGVLYIWFASSVGKPVFDAVSDNGFDIRALIVWNKIDPHYGNFMAQYMQKHEPCLYCVKDGSVWYGPTNEVTVWDIKQPSKNEFHPTEKPMECMARPIRNSTKKGDLVVDPFLGSGTTLLACENMGRLFVGADIDPNFVAVSIQRWVDLTGGAPNLLDTLVNV